MLAQCLFCNHLSSESQHRAALAQVKIFIQPGTHTVAERFFEQLAGIAYDHGGLEQVNPLQLLLVFAYGGIDLAVPPPAKLLIRHVALPLGRLLGYRGCYPEYMLP